MCGCLAPVTSRIISARGSEITALAFIKFVAVNKFSRPEPSMLHYDRLRLFSGNQIAT